MHSPIIRKIHPQNPQPDIIYRAAEIIKSGGVVAFPTRCLYGMGVDAFNPVAVNKVFEIKRRPAENPILVLIENKGQLDRLVRDVPASALQIMDYFWPGRVTIVFEAIASLPDNLTAGTAKIGVRMPGHAVALELVKAAGGPITGTSANLSGNPGCHSVGELVPAVARQMDFILDAGTLAGGPGSTVIDLTAKRPRVLREGEVTARDIMKILNRT